MTSVPGQRITMG